VRNAHANAYAYPDANEHRDADGDEYADGHQRSDSNVHTDQHPDPDGDSHANADSNLLRARRDAAHLQAV
jgi:hypothetical protein